MDFLRWAIGTLLPEKAPGGKGRRKNGPRQRFSHGSPAPLNKPPPRLPLFPGQGFHRSRALRFCETKNSPEGAANLLEAHMEPFVPVVGRILPAFHVALRMHHIRDEVGVFMKLQIQLRAFSCAIAYAPFLYVCTDSELS
jgi:hypothetical protein